MMGHLLGHKPQFVAFGRVLSCQLFMASRRMGGSPLWLDPVFGNLPGAVKRLTDNGVVGLLGQGPLAALMEGREIIFHEANDSLLWCGPGGDGQQQVRMSHKVCIHLQQGSLLQDERGKHHLCWQGDKNRRCCDYTGGCNLHLANPMWLQPEHGFFGLLDKHQGKLCPRKQGWRRGCRGSIKPTRFHGRDGSERLLLSRDSNGGVCLPLHHSLPSHKTLFYSSLLRDVKRRARKDSVLSFLTSDTTKGVAQCVPTNTDTGGLRVPHQEGVQVDHHHH